MSKLRIRHELLKKNGKIELKKFSEQGRDHYHLRVFIEGDLDRIEYVSYELHPTFNRPDRSSNDPRSNFDIDFWTWGEFEMRATVYFKTGTPKEKEIVYYLSYSDELPPDDASYLYVSKGH